MENMKNNLPICLVVVLMVGFAGSTLATPAEPNELVLGAGSFKSVYSRERGIVFNARPRGEWEYMATGTGRTGVAVQTHNQLLLQINHEGCIDEKGWFKIAGRLKLEFADDPFSSAAAAGNFKMTHDLRRSLIQISAGTVHEPFTVEIRAHMGRDVIRVDVYDGRTTPGVITLTAMYPDPCLSMRQDNTLRGTLYSWHANGTATEWHDLNMVGGMKNDSGFTDILANRCFGFAVQTSAKAKWGDSRIVLPAGRHTVFYIAAAAEIGLDRFRSAIADRFAQLPAEAQFIGEHEEWWNRFWRRVWFNSDNTMLKHLAAYDFYRYFGAVASGKNREFPLRFQIDLLRSDALKYAWAQMQINSIQTIEAYQGMFKNGDWDCLFPLLDFYRRTLPFYKRFTQNFYGHPGAIILYVNNFWGGIYYAPAGVADDPYGLRWRDKNIYPQDVRRTVVYSFEHGVALMQFVQNIADAKGDTALTTGTVLPYMRELCDFFNHHYRKVNGIIAFDPATSGETWYNVRNPSSWIILFRSFLPRVISLAQFHGDQPLAASAGELLASLPEIPCGKWKLTATGGERLPSDPNEAVLLPAELFNRTSELNLENPELYGLWPYLMLERGVSDYNMALRTYRGRAWKNFTLGWCLDVIWAARLGLTDEVLHDYETIHFPATVRCPGGFSYEAAVTWSQDPNLPLVPSMQGMGTSVCHIYEMVCQDQTAGIYVLPAWPLDRPLSIALYSTTAGRVEIKYTPGQPVRVKTERPVRVTFAQGLIPCAISANQGDFNDDCVVDVRDLAILVNNWLATW
jgi:hypothetical protein